MRTINFALPIIFVLGLLVANIVYPTFAYALIGAGVPKSVAAGISGWATLLGVLVASFVIVKRSVDFSAPSTTKKVIGHVILFIANIAALCSTVGPFIYAYFSGQGQYSLYAYYAIPVILVNFLLWPTGWVLAASRK